MHFLVCILNCAFVVQFTALPLNTVVKPKAQASFEYSFMPAQPMAGRPFGLVILLNYISEVRINWLGRYVLPALARFKNKQNPESKYAPTETWLYWFVFREAPTRRPFITRPSLSPSQKTDLTGKRELFFFFNLWNTLKVFILVCTLCLFLFFHMATSCSFCNSLSHKSHRM